MTTHIRGDFLSRADGIPLEHESEAQIAADATDALLWLEKRGALDVAKALGLTS